MRLMRKIPILVAAKIRELPSAHQDKVTTLCQDSYEAGREAFRRELCGMLGVSDYTPPTEGGE